ncbi:response regulator [Acetobacter sp. AN02]|uniref:ATP-binding protein n=1 Tax=Acetobacter sp. AN02 TaxID=2894186 RepID=UPI0024343321|nr:ATP-binding protein [Acetobacter sp. AN02]MDG6094535.1 response regulator [Acetobacter sp. AN02]
MSRLLLVGSDLTRTMGLDRALAACGFTVQTTESAESALALLDVRVPDLILADYRLPGLNGVQLAAQLRFSLAMRGVPFMLLVDPADRALEYEGLATGVDALVLKSADMTLLVFRVRALLRETAEVQTSVAGAFRRPVVVVLTGPGGRLYERENGSAFISILRENGNDVREITAGAIPTLPGEETDCLIADLTEPGADALAICRLLDIARQEGRLGSPSMRLMAVGGQEDMRGMRSAALYAAGVDDLTAAEADPLLFLSRVRALLRRKMFLDQVRQVESERVAQEVALEGVRAKAALSGALEAANAELAAANRQLIEAQSRLVQSAKMASLGELVAGVAHEFNNPLAFVMSHKETVLRCLAQAAQGLEEGNTGRVGKALEKASDRMKSCSTGLARMRDLVTSLRRFSRLDEGHFTVVDIPEAICTVLSLLGPKLELGIEVVCDFQAPWELHCQAGLIHQVVMNIISNAADALLAGGVPGVSAGRIVVATRLEVGHDREQSYVIEVTDNGPGVPAGLRERIFEPFFTTKPVGTGTGLGLATAYGIVQAHHGTIRVDEAPGGGARFVVRVPAEAQPVATEMKDVSCV